MNSLSEWVRYCGRSESSIISDVAQVTDSLGRGIVGGGGVFNDLDDAVEAACHEALRRAKDHEFEQFYTAALIIMMRRLGIARLRLSVEELNQCEGLETVTTLFDAVGAKTFSLNDRVGFELTVGQVPTGPVN